MTGKTLDQLSKEHEQKIRADERTKVLAEVEGGLDMLTRYERSIHRADHSDGEPLQTMLLEADVRAKLAEMGGE